MEYFTFVKLLIFRKSQGNLSFIFLPTTATVFFVNGTPVCQGPAIGDLHNWHYETLDIAPYLRSGKNVLAAQVYNLGEHRPGRQISYKTSFILQTDKEDQPKISTNTAWKTLANAAYEVLPVSPEYHEHYYRVFGFYTAGPGDRVDAKLYPWGWETLEYDDSGWENAKIVREDATSNAVGRGYAYGSTRFLVPRPIPLQEEKLQRFSAIPRSEEIKPGPRFLQGKNL